MAEAGQRTATAADERAFGCVVTEPTFQFGDVPEFADTWHEHMQGSPWAGRAPPFLCPTSRRDRVPQRRCFSDRRPWAFASEDFNRSHIGPVKEDLAITGV